MTDRNRKSIDQLAAFNKDGAVEHKMAKQLEPQHQIDNRADAADFGPMQKTCS